MENKISPEYLEKALGFLRGVLDSPEKRAWCREFGAAVPREFQEEVGGFLLDYRESGAAGIFRDALRDLDREGSGSAFPAEEIASMSDAELKGQLAGLMEEDCPFVLYGMSRGLLYRLYSELYQRLQKEIADGRVCRLAEEDLPEIAALCETLWPGRGEAMAELFAGQLADPKAALFGCVKDGGLIGFAHCRIRSDFVEGASENEAGVAYLEGLYLKDSAPSALAARLADAAGSWAKEMGCRELATDCGLDDAEGAALREAAGFAETARVICYIKEL